MGREDEAAGVEETRPVVTGELRDLRVQRGEKKKKKAKRGWGREGAKGGRGGDRTAGGRVPE